MKTTTTALASRRRKKSPGSGSRWRKRRKNWATNGPAGSFSPSRRQASAVGTAGRRHRRHHQGRQSLYAAGADAIIASTFRPRRPAGPSRVDPSRGRPGAAPAGRQRQAVRRHAGWPHPGVRRARTSRRRSSELASETIATGSRTWLPSAPGPSWRRPTPRAVMRCALAWGTVGCWKPSRPSRSCIVAVDPDAAKVQQLRRRFDDAGCMGPREVHHGRSVVLSGAPLSGQPGCRGRRLGGHALPIRAARRRSILRAALRGNPLVRPPGRRAGSLRQHLAEADFRAPNSPRARGDLSVRSCAKARCRAPPIGPTNTATWPTR